MQSRQPSNRTSFSEQESLRTRCAAAEAEADRLAALLEQQTAELERSRARFRDVIEHNPDAIVVVDREGVIQYVNGRAEALFATERSALQGTPFGFPMVAGETTELDVLLAEGARVVEMRVVETEWETNAACIASLRDVTERKRGEQAARRLIREQAARTAAEAAAERFQFLADASTLLSTSLDYAETLRTLARLCVERVADWSIIYVVDAQGAVQRLEVAHRDPSLHDTAQMMRELPIPPDSGHPVLEVLRTRRPLRVADIGDEQLAAMTQGEFHFDLARQLGVSSLMIVPLVARGRELGAIGLVSSDPARSFTDDDLAAATELANRAALAMDNVRLYRAAQEANEAKSNLLAVISHDLRTPLNSIMGHVELLAMGIPEQLSEETLQRVERIRLSAAHLVYLIDELLSFARLDSGHEELRLQELDARVLTREVAEVVEPLTETERVCLKVAVPAEPVSLVTDPDRLRQVLLNLVGNGLKYTERGEVRVTLNETAGGTLTWQVCDTGIGIDPAHIDHIFEPFWQADPTQRARNGGTGLGLSVVRRLVTLLGGTIAVTSEVGRGSTFTVKLPRAGTLTSRDP